MENAAPAIGARGDHVVAFVEAVPFDAVRSLAERLAGDQVPHALAFFVFDDDARLSVHRLIELDEDPVFPVRQNRGLPGQIERRPVGRIARQPVKRGAPQMQEALLLLRSAKWTARPFHRQAHPQFRPIRLVLHQRICGDLERVFHHVPLARHLRFGAVQNHILRRAYSRRDRDSAAVRLDGTRNVKKSWFPDRLNA